LGCFEGFELIGVVGAAFGSPERIQSQLWIGGGGAESLRVRGRHVCGRCAFKLGFRRAR
jgi:hypothetical protein